MKKYLIIIIWGALIHPIMAQKFPKVSFTSNLVNPKLLIMEDLTKNQHDSLGILYMKDSFIQNGTKIIGILSFTENDQTFSIWKIIQNGKSTSLQFLNKNNVISKANVESNFFIVNAFSKIKIEVFKQLLFENGELNSKGFKELHKKSRGNFGLLNISKLNSEIINNKENFIELLE